MTTSITTRFRRATKTIALVGVTLSFTLGAEAWGAKRVPQGNLTGEPLVRLQHKPVDRCRFEGEARQEDKAPVGKAVARVAATGTDGYTIDDAPATPNAKAPETARPIRLQPWSALPKKKTRGKRVGIVVRDDAHRGSSLTPRTRVPQEEAFPEGHCEAQGIDRRERHRRLRGADRRTCWREVPRRRDHARQGGTPDDPGPPVEEPPVEEPPVEEPPVEEPPRRGAAAVEEPPVEEPPVEGPATTSQTALVASARGPRSSRRRLRSLLHHDPRQPPQPRFGAPRRAPGGEDPSLQDVAFTVNGDNCQFFPFQGAGVDFCEADRHESWFLHDSVGAGFGRRVRAPASRWTSVTPAYQQEWINQVVDRLEDERRRLQHPVRRRLDGRHEPLPRARNGRADRRDERRAVPGRHGRVHGCRRPRPRGRWLPGGPRSRIPGIPLTAAPRSRWPVYSAMINREGLVRWGDTGVFGPRTATRPFWNRVDLAEDI